MECKHCTSLITPFFFLAAFYSASLKVHARTKCCSDTSKVMEFSKQKAFYTPNGMQRSLVNFQPLGPLSPAKGVRAVGYFMELGSVCWQTQASGFGWESHSGTHGNCAGDVCGKSRRGGSFKPVRRAHTEVLLEPENNYIWTCCKIVFVCYICRHFPHLQNYWS